MVQNTRIRFFLVAVMLSVAAWLCYQAWSSRNPAAEAGTERYPEQNLLHMKGFSSANYAGDQAIYRIEADELRISPHRVGIFKVRIYNEITLRNARVAGYLTEQLGRFEIFPVQKFGPVKRAVSDGFQLDLYRDGTPLFHLAAESARIDLAGKKTSLAKAVITHIPSAEKIAGRTIIWDEKAQVFHIPGQFLKETGKGRTSGQGLTIDLFYRQTPGTR